MKNFKNFKKELEKIYQKEKSIKFKMVEDILEWLKKNGLKEFLFFYEYDEDDDDYPYDETVKMNFDSIHVKDFEMEGEDAWSPLKKILIDEGHNRGQILIESEDSGSQIPLREEPTDVVLDIMNYLRKVTPDMIEQQKAHMEAEKFNMVSNPPGKTIG